MNRFEKLEWLEQTCSEEFVKETLVQEMVRWMGEDDFEAFYDHLCRHWEIKREEEVDTDLQEVDNGYTFSRGKGFNGW